LELRLTILYIKLLNLLSSVIKEGITGVLVLRAFEQSRESVGVLLELRKIKLILEKETETKL